jgi:hypothetical protein
LRKIALSATRACCLFFVSFDAEERGEYLRQDKESLDRVILDLEVIRLALHPHERSMQLHHVTSSALQYPSMAETGRSSKAIETADDPTHEKFWPQTDDASADRKMRMEGFSSIKTLSFISNN